MSRPLHAVVLFGGEGPEHEVSIASAATAAAATFRLGHRVSLCGVRRDGRWVTGALGADPEAAAAPGGGASDPWVARLTAHLADERASVTRGTGMDWLAGAYADVAIVMVHGAGGEDGRLSAILDWAGIAYTCAGIRASSLAFDKAATRAALISAGIAVPRGVRATDAAAIADFVSLVRFPMFVKANRCGSSVSVVRCDDRQTATRVATEYLDRDGDVLLEEGIIGREFTVGVVGNADGELVALPPTEIIPRDLTRGGFFDYTAKYDANGRGALEITPPEVSADVIARIQQTGMKVHRLLGIDVLSRTDLMMDEYGNLLVLESNTTPGFTRRSLVPQAAFAMGWRIEQLVQRMIDLALARPRPAWSTSGGTARPGSDRQKHATQAANSAS
jgi:D-alanine-D-alanine ligase